MSFFALIVFGLLVLGGLTVTVLLMISRKTRPYGMALLGVGVVGLIAIVAVGTLHLVTDRGVEYGEARNNARAVAPEMHRQMFEHGNDPLMPAMPEVIIDETHTSGAEAAGEGEAETPATTADSEPEEPYEETTEPTDTTKRPEWVDAPPGYSNGVYRTTVMAGPFPTVGECHHELRGLFDKAVRRFATEQLAINKRYAEGVRMSENDIQTHLVRQQWEEKPVKTSYGDWVNVHVLLEFDSEVQDYLRLEYQEFQQERLVAERLMFTGVALVSLLALLSIVSGTLKIDRATEGKKRGRLGLGAAVAASLAAMLIIGGTAVAHDWLKRDYFGYGSLWAQTPVVLRGPDSVLIKASESPRPVSPDDHASGAATFEGGRAVTESADDRVPQPIAAGGQE